MKISKLSKPSVMIPLALFCCFLWGSAFPAVKTGYNLFSVEAGSSASQILFAGVRFMLAGTLVIIIGSALSKKMLYPKNLKSAGRCFVLSLFQTVLQYTAFYIGLAHISGVKSSVLVSLNVFISLIISSVICKMERLTASKAVGSLIGFTGVVLISINGVGAFSGFSMNAEGAIILSAIAYSVSSVLIKRFSEKDDPVMLSSWQFLVGGAVLAIAGVALGGKISAQPGVKPYLLLLYLAFISAAAYTLWGLLLKHNPVSKVSVLGFMNPVFGVLLSALVLGESQEAFSAKNLVSLILVCIGIYTVNADFGKINKHKKIKRGC